jgi:hypothetical protein
MAKIAGIMICNAMPAANAKTVTLTACFKFSQLKIFITTSAEVKYIS